MCMECRQYICPGSCPNCEPEDVQEEYSSNSVKKDRNDRKFREKKKKK